VFFLLLIALICRSQKKLSKLDFPALAAPKRQTSSPRAPSGDYLQGNDSEAKAKSGI